MTLINFRDFPPGGFRYREVSLGNWENPDKFLGLDKATQNLQIVRAQNPASGLDPSYEACRSAIMEYTCKRLRYDPKFCGAPPSDFVEPHSSWLPKVGGRKGCAGCQR